MKEIEDSGDRSWTSFELTTLGDQVAPNQVSETSPSIRFSLIFLRGKYETNENILGIHPSGKTYAFIFKDTIRDISATQFQRKYIEQAVSVHEIGHAVGLVNNGVPMNVDHEDKAHPHHTINNDAVMHWQVETKLHVLKVVGDFIQNQDLNLFGPESLSDARGFQP